jgi:hypothetical protein
MERIQLDGPCAFASTEAVYLAAVLLQYLTEHLHPQPQQQQQRLQQRQQQQQQQRQQQQQEVVEVPAAVQVLLQEPEQLVMMCMQVMAAVLCIWGRRLIYHIE